MVRGLASCVALAIVSTVRAVAQCPNGTPPPCSAQRVASRPIDPNRIAVLPFRVTTTDTLLGEGFAELLASEFSGENGPRAVDMATVLSAWRRAGGGLRTPLPRERALALARELGAGLVSEGSIVGIGRQVTITANLVTATTGAARGRPTRVTSPADSIEAALRTTAAGLIAALGGQQRSLEGTRYTESAEAMRLYLQGLSSWRRGRLFDTMTSFERAMSLDSTFAQAAFRRLLTLSWALPPGTLTTTQVNERAWATRERLSPAERLLLEAVLGPNFPAPRPVTERLASRERAALLLPDSPEAQFLAADFLFHSGPVLDHLNHLVRARDYLERAAAIDSHATALRHLVEIAVRLRDTTRLRRLLPAYARTEDIGRWANLFLGYAILHDEAQLAQLRRNPVGDPIPGSQSALFTALVADVPAALLDELYALWSRAGEGTSWRDAIAYHYGVVLVTRGRPAAAERVWGSIRDNESQLAADRVRVAFALANWGYDLDTTGAVARMTRLAQEDSVALGADGLCELALWRLRHGSATADDMRRQSPGTCGRTLDIARIPLGRGDSTLRLLEHADSLARNNLGIFLRGYESSYLARAWEAVGRPDRALTAIRMRYVATFLPESPWLYPEEVRLALVVGDTAAAARTLRYYLPIVADAEPVIAARRDSLAGLLNRASP